MTIENFKAGHEAAHQEGSTAENLEMARKKMTQFEKDNLLVAESVAADKAKAARTRQALEAVTNGAGKEPVLAKYQEIKARRGELLDQQA